MHWVYRINLFLFVLIFINCGGRNETVITDRTTDVITISELLFIPSEINVIPGQIIFFNNEDDFPHHILSQSAPDQFDNTEIFDSIEILENDVGSITIPEDIAPGTTIYFYDRLMTDQMLTPNGSLTVE